MNRRQLLRGLAVCGAGLGTWALTRLGQRPLDRAPQGQLIDFHVHLFGVGDGGTGCFLSEEQREHVNYRFLLRLLGLSENGRMDQDYVTELVRQLRASSMDKALLFAQDGRYDARGRLDRANTHFYVPNDYLLKTCRDHPDLLIPCVSVNPLRRDALAELDRCRALGARAVKVHPPSQAVDPADPRHEPFWRRVQSLGLLLIVHTGMESATKVVSHELSRPSKLEPALEAGCTVIAAHAGFGGTFDADDFFAELEPLMRRHERLYCDTAVLASMLRWRNLPRLVESGLVLERVVHASDFPFPADAAVFWNRLPLTTWLDLCAEPNLFERDWRLEHALGLPAACFERGRKILP